MQSKGRNLYDFTFSAPKSVSILAEIVGDRRLIEAHCKAVELALSETESYAQARIRRAMANSDRFTRNLVVAVYQHDTSRQLDPQLHTHAVAANLTYDQDEGRWKALQARGVYERCEYLTEVYRNALALQVRELGYEIEDQRDSEGNDRGFQLQGVPERLIDLYSRRAREIEEAIKEFRQKSGREPSKNEIAVLTRESRDDKLVEISGREVHARQRSRLTSEQLSSLEELRNRAVARAKALEAERAGPALAYAEEHTFERVTVERDYKLLAVALRYGRGRIVLEDLKDVLACQERDGYALRNRMEITTQASLDRERAMVRAVNTGIGRYEPLGSPEFVASDRLSSEQKRAVDVVLGSCDLAVNICGAAGVGKTAMLQELHRGLLESRRTVVAVAPTMSAVDELQKVGFTNASTIDRMLLDQAKVYRAQQGVDCGRGRDGFRPTDVGTAGACAKEGASAGVQRGYTPDPQCGGLRRASHSGARVEAGEHRADNRTATNHG